MPVRVLIVENSDQALAGIRKTLEQTETAAVTTARPDEALARAAERGFDLILLGYPGDGEKGPGLISELTRTCPAAVLVALGCEPDVRLAVSAVKAGASDYLPQPVAEESLGALLQKAEAQRKKLLLPGRDYPFGRIVGQSPGIRKVFDRIDRVAQTDATVLITGESGTGKELVARAIHSSSPRRDRLLVPVNCGAIPEELLESELFGHEKGAFTNAIKTRIGRFELAEGGTIFLDEIGEMSPKLQVKLLRVLQDHQFERIGGTRTIRADIRVIAATNQDLTKAVAEGRFREDLYYRLNVIPIHVPPLRERVEDIPILVNYFLNLLRATKGCRIDGLEEASLKALLAYSWPGNVRELENLMERMAILSDGPRITLADLPERFSNLPKASPAAMTLTEQGFDLKTCLGRLEEDLIRQALALAKHNHAQAARLLGLNRTTLVEKLKRLGLMPS